MFTWKIFVSFLLPTISLTVSWASHYWLGPLSFASTFALIAGSLMIFTGASFLAWTSSIFAAFGQGTLAPWDDPQKLVIPDPFRYVRNPSAISIINILWCETLIFNSFYILGWSLIYWLMIQVYPIFKEEVDLEKKYGEAYARYKKDVPRWIPLDTPVKFDP
tara:strand:+ start:173 stop:658 length:486 start_codon:yes stop_codon:yes gene_type:complete